MTDPMKIHEHAPSELPPQKQRLLTSTIVTDVHGFIRRREAEGVKEVWVWRTERGQSVAAYFYEVEE